MQLQLKVKNQSIESSGITNDYKEAICEYIWNGFEAHATQVNIGYTVNIASGIDQLTISDNGDGIIYDDIADTFGSCKNVGVVTIKKLCDGLEITIPEFFGDSIFAELEPEL